ncbi:MAG: hypothetical protein EZS28_054779, partial [Streblomastix strix]
SSILVNVLVLIVSVVIIIFAIVGFVGSSYGAQGMKGRIFPLIVHFSIFLIFFYIFLGIGFLPLVFRDYQKYWAVIDWTDYEDAITKITDKETFDEKIDKYNKDHFVFNIIIAATSGALFIIILVDAYLMSLKNFVKVFLTFSSAFMIIFGAALAAGAIVFKFELKLPKGTYSSATYII